MRVVDERLPSPMAVAGARPTRRGRWRSEGPRWARFASSLALLLTACDEPALSRGLEVYLLTDLPLADVNVIAAESLEASGHVHATEWFEVREGCAASADGTLALGSFGVRSGSSRVAHLRLRAYRRNERNELVPTVERSADATFAEDAQVLSLLLGRACANQPRCDDGQACDPRDGACRPIQTIPVQPEPTPGAGCLFALGDQAPGTVVGNVPCSAADCTSECSRCDFPATRGECARFDYVSTAAPLADPDYQALCASDHVRVVCRGGVCESKCEEGYANCDGLPLRDGGCETVLFTKARCRSCDEACRYGSCSERDGCVAHLGATTNPELATASAALEPSKLYVTLLPIAVGDRKLGALGALIDAKVASRSLRLAIYHQRGTSLDLLYGTGNLEAVDEVHAAVAARDGLVRVEALVPGIELPSGTAFMIAVQVPAHTQLKSEPAAQLPWMAIDMPYGEFPLQLPPDVNVVMGPKIALYAVTTPD